MHWNLVFSEKLISVVTLTLSRNQNVFLHINFQAVQFVLSVCWQIVPLEISQLRHTGDLKWAIDARFLPGTFIQFPHDETELHVCCVATTRFSVNNTYDHFNPDKIWPWKVTS